MLLLEFGIYQSALQARPTDCSLRNACLLIPYPLLLALQGCFLVHLLLSWYFRDSYYRLYLRAKYWVKNRTVWRRASYGYGDEESEPLDKKKKKSSSRRAS